MTVDLLNHRYRIGDGVCELARPDASVLSLDEFVDPHHPLGEGIQRSKTFSDDLRLLEPSLSRAREIPIRRSG